MKDNPPAHRKKMSTPVFLISLGIPFGLLPEIPQVTIAKGISGQVDYQDTRTPTGIFSTVVQPYSKMAVFTAISEFIRALNKKEAYRSWNSRAGVFFSISILSFREDV